MKKNRTVDFVRFYAAVTILILLMGCSMDATIDTNDGKIKQSTQSGMVRSIGGIRWSSKLDLDSLTDIDMALSTPFEGSFQVERIRSAKVPRGLDHIDKAVMRNCRTYLDLRPLGYEAISDREFRVMKYIGARCIALSELKKAKTAKTNYLADFALDANAPYYFSPQLGLILSNYDIERRAEAERQGMSWKDFEPDIVTAVTGPDEIEVRGDGWVIQLTGYVWGDLDGDGVQDLLLRSDAWLDKGTWASVRLFRLTRISATGKLTIAQEYDL